MILLLGTRLRLLTPINLRLYKVNLQPFDTIDFFQDMQYHCGNILEGFNLLTLLIRRRHFDAFFLINVFYGTKCCSFVFEMVGLLDPIRNICKKGKKKVKLSPFLTN
jgi:hypothetical protein